MGIKNTKKERYRLAETGEVPAIVLDKELGTVTFFESATNSCELTLASITHAGFQWNGSTQKSSLHFYQGRHIVQTFDSASFDPDRIAIFIDYFGKLPK